MEILLLALYLVFIAAPASTYFHELGHALAANLVKADMIHITIGKGKQMIHLSNEKINTYVNRQFFLGAYTVSTRENPYTAYEKIFIALMGPLTNGIIVILLYILYGVIPNIYLELAFWFNLWLAIVNMIPFKWREKHTDGYTIYKEARTNNIL
ncbi:M50 family metallopeptidase [Oceanobacillus bengalensis]|uniref:M50 family peptidase n=1 Tax=Oceanobacillus bengalensis TaxID=1435466 RepID=A0A494Z0U5_9BACI|nr:M50 family metallopeptidase [Oceanobacillus bengalensis]RKQ16099.1 M50 family peptidase [Oceanobacillus bengalensis]